MTYKPNMTARKSPHDWTLHTGNSENGTSAWQRNWRKNSKATFKTPNPTSP